MAISVRGDTPATTLTNSDPVTVTLNGARQPQSGDRLLIFHGNDFYALSNMATPTVGGSTTGVTAGATADMGTNTAHAKFYYFEVGSTGDLVVSANETGSADEEKSLAVYVTVGHNAAVAPVSAGGTGDNPTQDAPSVTASGLGMLFCHVNTSAAAGSYTPPGGMSETYDSELATLTIGGASATLLAAGATGIQTFTAVNSTHYAALSVSVEASPTVPVVSIGVDSWAVVGGAFGRIAEEEDGGDPITAREWKVMSGPVDAGSVIGTDIANTWAPPQVGSYVLRYTATNGVGATYDELNLEVGAAVEGPQNSLMKR